MKLRTASGFVICCDLWETLATAPPEYDFLPPAISAGAPKKELRLFIRNKLMTKRYASYGGMVDKAFKHFAISRHKKKQDLMLHLWKAENTNPYYYPKTRSFLNALQRVGTLVLVSNLTYQGWREAKRVLKIQQYFKHTFLSWNEGIAKPNPEVWKRVMRKFPGVPATHFLMMGDSREADLQVPKSLGWKTVEVHNGKFPSIRVVKRILSTR